MWRPSVMSRGRRDMPLPTGRISRSAWQADRVWQQKNPEGRRIAVWHPRLSRVELYRLSGPACLEHRGHEVEYPITDEQATTRTIHSYPDETVIITLEWIP